VYKQWLLREPHDLLFQEFHYLVRLELSLPWFNSNSLLSLLQKCPMLQVLEIQNDKVCLIQPYFGLYNFDVKLTIFYEIDYTE
jgi:hypothetical protein